MNIHYQDDQVTLYHGDCLAILPKLADHSVDAVITDPPYELGFMGKSWDRDGVAFKAGMWRECLRILKPGGHLLAFGGTRTWHRLACAIEDSGFEIRDSICWLFGSGFPKSLDISKALDKMAGAEREVIGSGRAGPRSLDTMSSDAWSNARQTSHEYDLTAPATDAAKQWAGWGTALKPAHEPIILARKPIQGTIAQNVLEHGVGGLNIDGCRVEAIDLEALQKNWGRTQSEHQGIASTGLAAVDLSDRKPSGRWPANVILDDTAAQELDRQSGTTKSSSSPTRTDRSVHSIGATGLAKKLDRGLHDDSGGASRFFYTPKANTNERPTVDGIAHPTVKPLNLMRWLVRLITPPGGTVLDPFAGTGTTGEAAIHEHKHAILIERESTYLPLIVARITKPMEVGFDFDQPA